MTGYVIRGFDDDLWRKVKAKAAMEGMTIKDLIEQLLSEWVQRPAKKRSN